MPLVGYNDLKPCPYPIQFRGKRIRFTQSFGVSLGLRLMVEPPHDAGVTPQYDGEVARAYGDNNDVERLMFHEIGHYLVAAPSRRHLPNYGLGGDPDYDGNPSCRVSDDFCQVEEERADILGILMQWATNGHWQQTLSYHGWTQHIHDTQKKWTDSMKWLYNRGHITKGSIPVRLKKFSKTY